MRQKYPDEVYLACNVFGGDDSDVRNSTVKIVTVRKPFHCFLCGEKPVGTRAYYEHAVVDGEWRSNRACLPCVERECVDEMVEHGCLGQELMEKIAAWRAQEVA